MRSRPLSTEYAPFYETYVSLVPDADVVQVLQDQWREVEKKFAGVAQTDETFRYAPLKWTLRDVVGHLVDAERVFGLRAFCFSRGEQAGLPSFDENAYVVAGNYGGVPLQELVAEFVGVRQANLAFLRRLDDGQWMRIGTASTRPISVRALAYIMAGHVRHHLAIVEERYLSALRK